MYIRWGVNRSTERKCLSTNFGLIGMYLKARHSCHTYLFFQDEVAAKQLKLGKKLWQPCSSSGSAFIGLLSGCKTSNEALQLLLRVSETTSIQPHDVPDCITRLVQHLAVEQESAVRAKIISLLGELGVCADTDVVVSTGHRGNVYITN